MKKYLFPASWYALVVWCPKWSKSLGRTLVLLSKYNNLISVKTKHRIKSVPLKKIVTCISHWLIVPLLWILWQVSISYCKFLMPKALKWVILHICTLVIHPDILKNKYKSGMPEVEGGHVPPQVLGYRLTLFGPRGADYARHITMCPPIFSDDAASLLKLLSF